MIDGIGWTSPEAYELWKLVVRRQAVVANQSHRQHVN